MKYFQEILSSKQYLTTALKNKYQFPNVYDICKTRWREWDNFCPLLYICIESHTEKTVCHIISVRWHLNILYNPFKSIKLLTFQFTYKNHNQWGFNLFTPNIQKLISDEMLTCWSLNFHFSRSDQKLSNIILRKKILFWHSFLNYRHFFCCINIRCAKISSNPLSLFFFK